MFAQIELVVVVVALKHTNGVFVSKVSKNDSVSVVNVSVSVSDPNQRSRSRLGLEKILEGLGFGLVSDLKSKVSVSSRSRTATSRLHFWVKAIAAIVGLG